MDAVVAKMQQMETTITDMAGRIDAYVNKMDGMMTTIENNNISVKGTFDTKMGEMLTNMNRSIADAAGIQQAQLQALQTGFGDKVAGLEAKLQIASDYMAGAETAYIGTEQAQDDNKNKIATMEQEVIRIAAESADFKKQYSLRSRSSKWELNKETTMATETTRRTSTSR